ncbi:MAG TPA: hypothetical protein VGM56_20110 [Byssovorax sp.]|jgi:hypothetical protein
MSTRILFAAAVVAPFFLLACGEEVVIKTPVAPVVAVAAPLANGTLITGPVEGPFKRYWIILNGQKHLSELKTVEALGLDVEHARPEPEALVVPEGNKLQTDFSINRLIHQELTHLANKTLVRAPGNPRTYIILLGQRHTIDEPTFVGFGLNPGNIVQISPEDMAKIPEGPAW